MRHIHDHKVNGLNEALTITALDQPGPGGANHKYRIEGYQNDEPADRWPFGVRKPFASVLIEFQNGPIGSPADMNGISNEALLAVVIDRMRGFQHQRLGELTHPAQGEAGSFDFNSRGQYACRENAIALTHLEDALMWLQKRTRDRMARGVEGTHKA